MTEHSGIIEYSDKDKYEPVMLIAIYELKFSIARPGPAPLYLETHDVTDNKTSEGKPLRYATLSRLEEFLHRQKKKKVDKLMDISGYTDPSFIYIDPVGHNYAWICKEGKKRLYFSKNLRIKDGEAWIPDLLFILAGTALDIFAIKDHSYDTNTKLYHAPFPNTSKNGAVCLGNIGIKKHKSYDFIAIKKLYEEAFFNSEFSELHSRKQKGLRKT